MFVEYLVERRQDKCGCVFEGGEPVRTPQRHPDKEHGTSQQRSILHVHPGDDGRFLGRHTHTHTRVFGNATHT